MSDDQRWMAEAIALSWKGRGQTAPNPNVGCVIVQQGQVVGHGWTQPGGRPHAEAMALVEAGDAAKDADIYVTLEPCAHASTRGPRCVDLLIAASPARVSIATLDADPRTRGLGVSALEAAGINVNCGLMEQEARDVMRGFFMRMEHGRPYITLKLAMSLDGCIAMANGESQWITGDAARHHCHLERAWADMILVGGETLRHDNPRLDVRIVGMEALSPHRAVLSRSAAPEGWQHLSSPEAVFDLAEVNDLFVEGGAGAASAFLAADLVDRLLIYRAPILIGHGKASLVNIGLSALPDAHGRWQEVASERLGDDRLCVYQRLRT